MEKRTYQFGLHDYPEHILIRLTENQSRVINAFISLVNDNNELDSLPLLYLEEVQDSDIYELEVN